MRLRSGTEPSRVERSLKRKRPEDNPNQQPQKQRQPALRRAALTRRNLQEYTEAISPIMASRKLGTDTSKSTRTSDPKFAQRLRENNVVFARHQVRKPTDLESLRRSLDRQRESGSPDSEEYMHYVQAVHYAPNEATYGQTGFAMLRKPPARTSDKPYITLADQEWTDVGDSHFARGCSTPKPDLIESYAMDTYPTQVVADLGPFVQPSRYNYSMPYLAVELKAPNTGQVQAASQAAYDGAIMTEGIMKQHEHLGQGSQYLKTHALTVTANGSEVGIQSHHAVRTAQGPQHHMVSIFDDVPLTSRETYSRTRRHVRNAQDWARKQADDMLQDLRNHPGTGMPTPVSPSLDTLPPSDGLEDDHPAPRPPVKLKLKIEAKRSRTAKRRKAQ